MVNSLLQDRLRDHAKAFDGLLGLIPAKIYYGDDNDGQAFGKNRTKRPQSKNETAAIRRTKFDPYNRINKNAKEVLDERARNKRKLIEHHQDTDDGDEDKDSTRENYDHGDDNDDSHVMEGIVKETPGQGFRKSSNKRQKLDRGSKNKSRDTKGSEDKDICALPGPRRRETAKQESRGETRTKRKRKANGKLEGLVNHHNDNQSCIQAKSGTNEQKDEPGSMIAQPSTIPPSTSNPSEGVTSHIHIDTNSGSHLVATSDLDNLVAASLVVPTISISSKHVKVATAKMETLRARLTAKIEALRAARKADGTNDRPIRTRQELIESRRAKQAQRKAHKLELRRQAKFEEEQKREETLVINSPMSPSLNIDEETVTASLSFGRVSFKDGAQLSHDLSRVLGEGKKKKGPSDPKTALNKLQNRKKWIETMDKEMREDVQMNDVWSAAKRQALGEKVLSEPTLKKTIKRKEQAKKKSEQQWLDRMKLANHVAKEKQRKREDNIQKRKVEKSLGKAGHRNVCSNKKNARPGFEGNLGLRGKKK